MPARSAGWVGQVCAGCVACVHGRVGEGRVREGRSVAWVACGVGDGRRACPRGRGEGRRREDACVHALCVLCVRVCVRACVLCVCALCVCFVCFVRFVLVVCVCFVLRVCALCVFALCVFAFCVLRVLCVLCAL